MMKRFMIKNGIIGGFTILDIYHKYTFPVFKKENLLYSFYHVLNELEDENDKLFQENIRLKDINKNLKSMLQEYGIE